MEWIDKAIEQLNLYNLSTEQEDDILDMMLEQRTEAELEGFQRGKAEMLAKMQTFLIREGHHPWTKS